MLQRHRASDGSIVHVPGTKLGNVAELPRVLVLYSNLNLE